jgi:predicted transcriptional regulator
MQTKVNIKLENKKVNKAVQVLRALDHSMRPKVLNWVSENPGSNVSEVMEAFNMDQSQMSQYLGTLRHAGFLNGIREGKNVNYYVADGAFKIINAVKKFTTVKNKDIKK